MDDDELMAESEDSTPTILNFDSFRTPLVNEDSIVAEHPVPGLLTDESGNGDSVVVEMTTIEQVPVVVHYDTEETFKALLEKIGGGSGSVPVRLRIFWAPGTDVATIADHVMTAAFNANDIYNNEYMGVWADESGSQGAIQKIAELTGLTQFDSNGQGLHCIARYQEDHHDMPFRDFPQALDHLGAQPFPFDGFWTSSVVNFECSNYEEYKTFIESDLERITSEIITHAKTTSAGNIGSLS